MRWVIRIVAGLVLVLVLALGGLALWLPRLVERPEVRAEIEAAAQRATGRTLSYQKLDVGLLPPRLVMDSVALKAKGAAPLAARSVSLQVALAPLLARTVVVDTVVLDGVDVTLERGKGGVTLPGFQSAGGAAGEAGKDAPGASPDAGFAVAVREVSLRDSRVALVDRTLAKPVTWQLEGVDVTARGVSPDAPIPFHAAARLASGGKLEADGSAGLDGAFDAKLAASDLALAPLAPYLPAGARAAGSAQVEVRARGNAERLDAFDLALDLAADELASGDARVSGRLPLRLDLAGPLSALAGHFDLDATAAAIDAGDAFRKAAGVPLSAKGALSLPAAGGVALEGVALDVAGVPARASLQSARRTRLQLDAAAFPVSALAPLSPKLAALGSSGRLALEGMVVELAPLAVKGDVALEDVGVPVTSGADARLTGRLQGQGDRIAGKGLTLRVAGQPFRVDVAVLDLATQPRFALDLAGDQLDSNALMTGLADRRDTLSGPLTLSTTLAGPLGGERKLVDAVVGDVKVDLSPGRLRGVSFLRSAVDALGAAGQAALVAGQTRGSRDLQRFYEDEFQHLTGSFQLRDGQARTQDLTLDYRDYRVALRGRIGLDDLSLDLTGDLTLFENVDAAMASAYGQADARPVKRTLPLASIRGTLDAPRVAISPELALRFGAAYALDDKRREDVRKKIDKTLGTGSGDQVLDVLEGILGGKKQP